MTTSMSDIQDRLWEVADQLRTNANLTSAQYKAPTLGLLFLKFVDTKFSSASEEIQKSRQSSGRVRPLTKDDYKSRNVIYVPEHARFSSLMQLPESADIGRAVSESMSSIEDENPELRGVLQKDYSQLNTRTLTTLLRMFGDISLDTEDDVFGRVYEYFLGKFALAEGNRGGEFYTPGSLVRLIVEIVQPFEGTVYDPACGSGGMFVQSANFVKSHQKDPTAALSIYGQELVTETAMLTRMNLAINGLPGDIRVGNAYEDDPHNSVGKFDFVMANPPFNVDIKGKSGLIVDIEQLKGKPRVPFGVPESGYANHIWIQLFWSALNDKGRAGFVVPNGANDPNGKINKSIQQQLLDTGSVDVIVAVSSNFFMNVTVPCTLWFFDKGKKGSDRSDKVLFIDARETYEQVDRAHREFSPAQIEFISNIVRLYRGNEPESSKGSDDLMLESFPDLEYKDVAGLCKVATLEEIEEQGYSLSPGRYVGVKIEEEDDEDFYEKLSELSDELEGLNLEARELERTIGQNLTHILGQVSEQS